MGGVAPESGVPLARLFVMGAGQLLNRLHEHLEARGWRGMRPAFGYILGAVREEPMTVSDIAAFLGVSKQAASKIVTTMVDAGYVSAAAHPTDSRAKLVAITPRGHALLTDAEEIYRDLEGEWAALVGRSGIESIRADLTTILRATNDGQLPPVRPTQ
jgi:DNA-binding MarR family transcriptional regulator